MGAGKSLSIVAGVFTLLGVFILNWVNSTTSFVYGLGGLMGLGQFFENIDTWAFLYGLVFGDSFQDWMIYLIAVEVILLGISPILQFVGAKSKAAAIIGSLLPLAIGLIILLSGMEVFSTEISAKLTLLFGFPYITSDVLVENIIPFTYGFEGRDEAIGLYALLGGGFLGLISGFMSRDDF